MIRTERKEKRISCCTSMEADAILGRGEEKETGVCYLPAKDE